MLPRMEAKTSKIHPNWLLEPSGPPPWPIYPKFWFQKLILDLILGPGGDPKIGPKSTFSSKRRAKEHFFDEFGRERNFSRFFHRFWYDFELKIDAFSNAVFQHIACFFRHGEPHNTLYFTIRNDVFCFSRFWDFPEKMIKKRSQTVVRKKKTRKRTLPGPLLGPNID